MNEQQYQECELMGSEKYDCDEKNQEGQQAVPKIPPRIARKAVNILLVNLAQGQPVIHSLRTATHCFGEVRSRHQPHIRRYTNYTKKSVVGNEY